MANEIIFLMGNAASGKSTIVKHHFSDRQVIDADNFKVDAHTSHMESVSMAERATVKVIKDRVNGYVIDGTGGSTGSTLVSMMRLAKKYDFTVRLVYVRCDVVRCLHRNSKRERRVPVSVIVNKAANIEQIFTIAKKFADRVEIIEN